MDIAVQRPLIVTCSREDSTIRIWNYYNYTCEQAKIYSSMDDAPLSKAVKPLLTVAMHPSGYYMAAGFMDKIRIYHILHNGIKVFRNVEIKHCSKIKFSNGGHWFVATDSRNIYFYNSYTLQRIGKKEPLASPNVTDIRFNAEDTCVAICTSDGYVYRYKTRGGLEKLNDGGYSDKTTAFSSCTFTYEEMHEY